MGKLAVSENDLFNNDELLDSITRAIAKELADAVEKNSVARVKELKFKYGNLQEFVTAKNFLNRKCKDVYNVFEKPDTVPQEAMKSLGITNQPSLDFLLGDSMRYFEKNNGITTVQIIKSILNNRNLKYTIEDINNYLYYIYKKENCKCNSNTAQYLVAEHKYTKQMLLNLGLSDNEVQKYFTSTPKLFCTMKKILTRYR